MSKRVCTVVFCITIAELLCNQAQATPPSPARSYGAPPPYYGGRPADSLPSAQEEEGEFLHDGFYLRLGIGPSWMHATLETEQRVIEGAGMSFDVGIGGSPTKGFALGGRLAVSAAGTSGGADWTKEHGQQMTLVQVFGDIYPLAGEGFHILLAAGYGEMAWSLATALDTEPSSTTANASGLALLAGAGWEGWVSEQWGLGAMLACSWARLQDGTREATTPLETSNVQALAPSITFTATYH